ncbi:copper amine oxidase-like domain-containing protein [Desulfofundulus kuznetsovii DSM 6115]|uniref:Copper amine oxidase-like domain-containing protein n=1 Tax=Desulfofundulus kuznetsovii (strain DSM 6115 / VKM B-1805 / 17) TaxID=760568 RepID=A0AAU8P945_DESK7|nr:copper amine oxidase-like domain-containing protein [Desulfofundulus kuznetsovii DSM 6115]
MVKRKALISVLALLFLVTVLAFPALAQQEKVDVYENQKLVKSVVFQIGLKEYCVNGQTPGVKMDVAPFVEAGRTFVPVRFLSNALGVEDKNIGWNEKARLVTLKQPGYPVVELVVGSKQLKSNGQVTNMDVSPLVRSGRTFLPARWVAEALGYQVDWDASLGLVVCWPKGEPKPDLSAVKQYLNEQKPAEEPAEEPVEPVNPVGTLKELLAKAKPIEGKPFSFSSWKFDPEIQEQLQRFWDSIDASPVIQEVSVSELRPYGIKLGKDAIIHDIDVTKDGITITASTPGRFIPFFYLVEEGNVVRYKGGGGYMGKETGTLSVPVDHIRAWTPDGMHTLPPADLTKVTHVMFPGTDGGILLVKNPLYKGGN